MTRRGERRASPRATAAASAARRLFIGSSYGIVRRNCALARGLDAPNAFGAVIALTRAAADRTGPCRVDVLTVRVFQEVADDSNRSSQQRSHAILWPHASSVSPAARRGGRHHRGPRD